MFSIITVGYNSAVEKERLHNVMAYGKARIDQEGSVQQPSLEGPAEIDRFDESQSVYSITIDSRVN